MPAAPHPRMHGITHVPGGPDPIPGLGGAPVFEPFFDAMMTLAATRDLRGYWRLGEGAAGPYADSSGRPTPAPADKRGSAPALTDVAGALPAGQDDGAVQFNSSTGAGNFLGIANVWGTVGSNPFAGDDIGTVMGWVKPAASSSTFDGGIFSTMALTSTHDGYVVGVAWPARTVFHQRNTTRLTGPVLTADEWVFVTGVKDSVSTRIYLNGALVATGTAVAATDTNVDPLIGLWSSSSGAGGIGAGVLYGAVDEISVWADALTDAEIATLAGSGLATDPAVRSVINTVAAYTANPGETVFANGTFTITLPTAVANLGEQIVVKNTGAGTITVGRTSSQTIDGTASDVSLTTLQARRFVSDGTGWQQTGTYP